MPSNVTISRPRCGRASSTLRAGGAETADACCEAGSLDRGLRFAAPVDDPAGPGSVTSTAPGAKRSSGSSVRTSTTTSPRTPCGRTISPTTSSIDLVRVHDVDPDTAATDRADDLPQRL